ncbi:MAG TPA: hypothetical protein VFG69_15380 [Nannocystaceae bacterium]|nr:hypothetical protein [Nannocystaceae bacterium]
MVDLREAFRRIARRVARFVAIAATISCGYPFPTPYEADRGVYSEFLAFADVEIEMPTLAAHETELYLAITPDDIGTGALESVLSAARREGVPVRAWLLLADADGYWPSEQNLAAFREHVDEFWRWNRRNDLGVTRILVDMEPPLDVSNELAAAIESGQLADAIPVLLANRDAEAFAAAQADWADAVDEWHEAGMLVDAVALPHVLDDYGDDDLDIHDMFDSPIDGVEWDELGFLVYQNLYGMPDARLGPDLVQSYGRTARERHGAITSVALGTIGDIGKNTSSIGYADVESLRADVGAAAAAGLERVQLFSLDGMREQGGSALWLDDLELAPIEVEPTQAVQQARAAVAALDGL